MERDKVEEFGINIYTLCIKIDNQEGPTVQHRELYSIFYSNCKAKESEKKKM